MDTYYLNLCLDPQVAFALNLGKPMAAIKNMSGVAELLVEKETDVRGVMSAT
jgi:hypothetical protein